MDLERFATAVASNRRNSRRVFLVGLAGLAMSVAINGEDAGGRGKRKKKRKGRKRKRKPP